MTRSRWSSRTTDVVLVTAGDPKRRTGGNLYAQRMIGALRRDGLRVCVVRLTRASGLRDVGAPVVIVDTIAAPLAARGVRTLRARGARVIVMALMSKGALTLARHADRIVAPSRALADELAEGRIARRRIAVVRPGQERIAADAPRRYGTRVLCVANWSPAKGIHVLLTAMAGVPGLDLDLIGDAPDAAYAARVRRLAASRELAGRVRTHGSLSPARLERRYREAAVFALPSLRESYGMALAAALAHGLPSVACDIPATREVSGGAAILVAPGRAGPLATALRALASDRRLRERLSRRARARARGFPPWQESEARFVKIVRAELRAARGARG